jgi:hypothetical protein
VFRNWWEQGHMSSKYMEQFIQTSLPLEFQTEDVGLLDSYKLLMIMLLIRKEWPFQVTKFVFLKSCTRLGNSLKETTPLPEFTDRSMIFTAFNNSWQQLMVSNNQMYKFSPMEINMLEFTTFLWPTKLL